MRHDNPNTYNPPPLVCGSTQVMFNIHSFMVDGRSGFLTAGLGFKHLRDEQQAQHGGVPVVETDEHPEVVRAALHWLYTGVFGARLS